MAASSRHNGSPAAGGEGGEEGRYPMPIEEPSSVKEALKTLSGYIPQSIKDYLPSAMTAGSGSNSSAAGSGGGSAAADAAQQKERPQQPLSISFSRQPLDAASNRSSIHLALGYADGFQVWNISRLAAPGCRDACYTQLLSRRGGTAAAAPGFQQVLSLAGTSAVRIVHVLSCATPCSLDTPDAVPGQHPIVALVAAAAAGSATTAANEVHLYSTASHSRIHTLKFRSRVHQLVSNDRYLAVVLATRIFAFDSSTFEEAFAVGCYPNARTTGVAALGTRWLAFPSDTPAPAAPAAGGFSSESAAAAAAAAGRRGSWVGGLWGVAKDIASGLYYITEVSKSTIAYVRGSQAGEDASGAGEDYEEGDGSGGQRAIAPNTVGSILVRDLVTRQPIAHLRSHTTAVAALAFDRSGSLLASSYLEGQTIHVHRIAPPTLAAGHSSNSIGASYATAQLLFALERGVTHASVRQLAFADDSMWLCATSEHGTSHMFSLTSQPPPALAPSTDSSSSAHARPAGLHQAADALGHGQDAEATWVVPGTAAGSTGAAGGGSRSTASASASVVPAPTAMQSAMAEVAMANNRHHALAVGSWEPASQPDYIALYEAQRRGGAALPATTRGVSLRIKHAPLAAAAAVPEAAQPVDSTPAGDETPTAGAGAGAGASEAASTGTATATAAATAAAEGTPEEAVAGRAAMPASASAAATATKSEAAAAPGLELGGSGCATILAGKHLLACCAGVLRSYALQVTPQHKPGASPSIKASTEGTWDVRRRPSWAQHVAAMPPVWAAAHSGSSAVASPSLMNRSPESRATAEELRGHWLSNAEIVTHSPELVPLWASPMFTMFHADTSGALDLSAAEPIQVRREGPQPVMPQTAEHAAATGSAAGIRLAPPVRENHFDTGHANASARPPIAASAPTAPPKPVANAALSAGIRDAITTSIEDSFNPTMAPVPDAPQAEGQASFRLSAYVAQSAVHDEQYFGGHGDEDEDGGKVEEEPHQQQQQQEEEPAKKSSSGGRHWFTGFMGSSTASSTTTTSSTDEVDPPTAEPAAQPVMGKATKAMVVSADDEDDEEDGQPRGGDVAW